MAGGDHGNQRHTTAERRARAVQLRDEGLTFPQIAAEMGLALSTVWRHYQNAMRAIPAPIIAAHAEAAAARKAEQLERIDMQRDVVMAVLAKTGRTVVTPSGKVIEGVEDDATVLAAVDRLHKLDDQEAKLLGLYAEQKMNLSGGIRYELVGIDPADLT